jgi:hypothetical protein
MPTVRSLALVRDTTRVDLGDLTRVAAALQKQVLTDFVPAWRRPATVDAFVRLEDVPVGHWPMIVRDDIPYDAEGIHLDNQWGPFALVRWAPGWSLTASHECLEMLADPYGRRLRQGPSLKAGQGTVQYLVEVCDPSEAEAFAYEVDGIVVSDFYMSAFFDKSARAGARYSFTNAIKRPRQVLRGGYISWRVRPTGEWWQQTFFGASLQFPHPEEVLHPQGSGRAGATHDGRAGGHGADDQADTRSARRTDVQRGEGDGASGAGAPDCRGGLRHAPREFVRRSAAKGAGPALAHRRHPLGRVLPGEGLVHAVSRRVPPRVRAPTHAGARRAEEGRCSREVARPRQRRAAPPNRSLSTRWRAGT